MNGGGWVALAATTFVGTHFVLSHPLRRVLVARMGEGGFTGLYSAVAFVTLGWLGWASLPVSLDSDTVREPVVSVDRVDQEMEPAPI